MSNLDNLQGRILAAMERIGAGVEGLAAPAPVASWPEGESPEELRQQLEDERTVTAQLDERVKALHLRLEEMEAALAEAAQAPRGPDPEVAGALARMDEDMARLRAANAALRDNNRLLREAQGKASYELMNAALATELEALRADHAAAQGEAATILAALTTLVAEAPEAAGAGAEEGGV